MITMQDMAGLAAQHGWTVEVGAQTLRMTRTADEIIVISYAVNGRMLSAEGGSRLRAGEPGIGFGKVTTRTAGKAGAVLDWIIRAGVITLPAQGPSAEWTRVAELATASGWEETPCPGNAKGFRTFSRADERVGIQLDPDGVPSSAVLLAGPIEDGEFSASAEAESGPLMMDTLISWLSGVPGQTSAPAEVTLPREYRDYLLGIVAGNRARITSRPGREGRLIVRLSVQALTVLRALDATNDGYVSAGGHVWFRGEAFELSPVEETLAERGSAASARPAWWLASREASRARAQRRIASIQRAAEAQLSRGTR